MKLTDLFNTDDRAVSPVIGVILMVAITVILAAVIGTFVLGLGDQVQQTSPNAQFAFDWDSGGDGGNGELGVTHDGGDGIEGSELALRGSDLANPGTWQDQAGYTDTVRAGDSVTVNGTGGEFQWDGAGAAPADATVLVVWEDSDSDRSSTLRTWNRD